MCCLAAFSFSHTHTLTVPPIESPSVLLLHDVYTRRRALFRVCVCVCYSLSHSHTLTHACTFNIPEHTHTQVNSRKARENFYRRLCVYVSLCMCECVVFQLVRSCTFVLFLFICDRVWCVCGAVAVDVTVFAVQWTMPFLGTHATASRT